MRMTADEATLARMVGVETFRRGRRYADEGAVLDVEVDHDCCGAVGDVSGSGPVPYETKVAVRWAADGSLKTFTGRCSCPVQVNCKHAVAVVLAGLLDGDEEPRQPAVPWSPAGGSPSAAVTPLHAPWERSLLALVQQDDESDDAVARVALQLELRNALAGARAARIELRPVLPGRNGGWVRTGVSWHALTYTPYQFSRIPTAQVRLLQEIAALDRSGTPSYYSYSSDAAIDLVSFHSRRLWDLLAEAQALGLPLVAGKGDGVPLLLPEPVEVTVDVRRQGEDLRLEPRLVVGSNEPQFGARVLIGDTSAHGVAWWRDADAGELGRLHLARLASPADGGLRELIETGGVTVPEAQRERFLSRYYPVLRERVVLTSTDASVELPQPEPPVLQLSVGHLPGHRAELEWQWRYRIGEAVQLHPLRPATLRPRGRDLAAERARLEEVVPAAKSLPDLWELPVGAEAVETPHGEAPGERRLRDRVALSGMAVVALLGEVLPQLEAVPDLVLQISGSPADYREANAAPVIEIDGDAVDGGRDWFDLAVTVTVDGEDVPFPLLFSALASGRRELILPSGTWFALDRPEFSVLADLIAEARSLQDHDDGTLRLSRYQASFWAELEQIGVVTGQAVAWQRQVRSLADIDALVEPPAPAGLQADLRPYQRVGYSWLSLLHRHGLGGVLADEMGLGKTLQALALMASAREADPAAAPFLVVAPTSVVTNWASECRRFAPDLTVRVVTETRAKRKQDLWEVVGDADVVLTSYTLFRLESEDYEGLPWSGLVLDEAQFVKNHKSKAYACARRLPAPFKLAITGTPMENNLMELWSLLSITAPGLFPDPRRFDETYRTPIEKGQDADLLERLRRRVRPLMLRRSKDEVVRDLPAKQEQVLELPLNPKHRKVYQTHLQRERQKVLGLLGNLEKHRFEVFRSLTLLRQASLDAALVDPRYADIPSTKLDHLSDQLDEITREGHRVLVFSQFTRFLEHARLRAQSAGLDHCYLDGKTKDRAAVIERFKSGEAPVFFISLKAGGFGLNLTEADYCILLDPWWNPAAEAQAVDRVHRIGQSKQVMVYRLVAQETIEEKVMALKAGKSALFSSVMDGGDFAGGALSADDIRGMLS